MTTDLVAELRGWASCLEKGGWATPETAPNCDSTLVGDLRTAADELARLQRERDQFSGLAAERNRRIAMIADERDQMRSALQDIHDWYSVDTNEDRGGHALEVSGAVLASRALDVSAEPRCTEMSPSVYSKQCALPRGHEGPHEGTEHGVTDKWSSDTRSVTTTEKI